jgi:hypothetical protein
VEQEKVRKLVFVFEAHGRGKRSKVIVDWTTTTHLPSQNERSAGRRWRSIRSTG